MKLVDVSDACKSQSEVLYDGDAAWLGREAASGQGTHSQGGHHCFLHAWNIFIWDERWRVTVQRYLSHQTHFYLTLNVGIILRHSDLMNTTCEIWSHESTDRPAGRHNAQSSHFFSINWRKSYECESHNPNLTIIILRIASSYCRPKEALSVCWRNGERGDVRVQPWKFLGKMKCCNEHILVGETRMMAFEHRTSFRKYCYQKSSLFLKSSTHHRHRILNTSTHCMYTKWA